MHLTDAIEFDELVGHLPYPTSLHVDQNVSKAHGLLPSPPPLNSVVDKTRLWRASWTLSRRFTRPTVRPDKITDVTMHIEIILTDDNVTINIFPDELLML